MSKRIVLKSVIAVVMVGFILSFSSCKKEEKLIVGKWKYEKIEIKELACTDPETEMMLRLSFQFGASMIAEELGLKTMEFTKDGKVITNQETASYKVNGNKLTITNSDYLSGNFDISFEKKTTMYVEMDLMKFEEFDAEENEEDGITKCILLITFAKQKN